MGAANWFAHGVVGDDPSCACPVIRNYAIGLNDLMPDEERQRLKSFILRVVGNRDPDAEAARERFIRLETARRVVPLVFDRAQPELAAEMRALPNDASDGQIRELMERAGYAAAYVAAALLLLSASAAVAGPKVWDEAIDILDGALRIGRQAPEFSEEEVLVAVARFEKERIHA